MSYLRRVLRDLEATPLRASTHAVPPYEFTMPDGTLVAVSGGAVISAYINVLLGGGTSMRKRVLRLIAKSVPGDDPDAIRTVRAAAQRELAGRLSFGEE
jgi:hypothetical protein